jgi:hypothetical protein
MSRSLIAAALWVAAAANGLAAEPPADDRAKAPWIQRVFGSSKPDAEPPSSAPIPAPVPTWKDVSRSLEQERAIYMDRLQYCTRLRQIAVESNDEELLRKADELEELAEAVYTKRTRSLPSIVEDVKAAEAARDQRRPAGAPAGSASATPRVTGRAPNGRPIIARE